MAFLSCWYPFNDTGFSSAPLPAGERIDSPYDKSTTTSKCGPWYTAGVINFLVNSSSGLHSTAGRGLVVFNQPHESFCFFPAQNERGAVVCYSISRSDYIFSSGSCCGLQSCSLPVSFLHLPCTHGHIIIQDML